MHFLTKIEEAVTESHFSMTFWTAPFLYVGLAEQ